MNERVMTDDAAAADALSYARREGIETAFDRYRDQQPQCGFGSLGLCCRICWKGPCRIDPFGAGPQRGICGADKHTIVARQLARTMAAGGAAHSEHGRHLVHVLEKLTEGKAKAYTIHDEEKLKRVATMLGIKTNKRAVNDIASDIVSVSLSDFSNQDPKAGMKWMRATLPAKRIKVLDDLEVIAPNIDMAVSQSIAWTNVGCDAEPLNLLKGGFRAALCDYDGMAMATEISDILFGTPSPVTTEADLGVINEHAVNIALNGHNPAVSEAVCAAVDKMQDKAKALGAKDGINLVGVCCTGNEVALRHGIPMAANYLSQELVMVTGAVDAMVVDVQCVMPGLTGIAHNFHTTVITTHDENRIPGAVHVSVHPEDASESAEKIVQMALDAYQRRDPKRVHIPDVKATCIVGFSAEAIADVLKRINADDPMKPIVDSVASGDIQGIVLFAGCNTTQIDQDKNFKILGRELAKRDVLILATGCGAGAFAKDGLMTQEATREYAGPGLRKVLDILGETAGLDGPLPLVLHMGSCVDNSRAISIATMLANRLDLDFSELPIVASAPEAMAEKAVAIASWAVALGFPAHLGNIPQIMGSDQVVELLTEKTKEVFGGHFVVEPDPVKAADKLFAEIQLRRKNLNKAAV